MTRWCPVCENPGIPVVRGSLSLADIRSLESRAAVRVRERLPGIEPTHFCKRCPTFFRARDRFYLCSRREDEVHGIAVWPHRQARVRIELASDGLVFVFGDQTSVLVPGYDFSLLMSDFFWGHGRRELISWAHRRGFTVRIEPDGNGEAEFRVDPAGPHFVLLVAKAWSQENELRTADLTIQALEWIDADPLVFSPSEVPS